MFAGRWAVCYSSTTCVSSAISKLLPQKLSPSISWSNDLTLFQLLTRDRYSGSPTVLASKKKSNWSWKIIGACFKGEGKYGKVWGIFYLDNGSIFLDVTPQLSIKSNQHVLKYSWVEDAQGPLEHQEHRVKRQKQIKPGAEPRHRSTDCMPAN